MLLTKSALGDLGSALKGGLGHDPSHDICLSLEISALPGFSSLADSSAIRLLGRALPTQVFMPTGVSLLTSPGPLGQSGSCDFGRPIIGQISTDPCPRGDSRIDCNQAKPRVPDRLVGRADRMAGLLAIPQFHEKRTASPPRCTLHYCSVDCATLELLLGYVPFPPYSGQRRDRSRVVLTSYEPEQFDNHQVPPALGNGTLNKPHATRPVWPRAKWQLLPKSLRLQRRAAPGL